MAGPADSVTDAEAIAQCRAMFPVITTTAASDVFLGVWLTWARAQVGPAWRTTTKSKDALALLLAHQAYRVDPAGVLGSGGVAAGPVTGLSTLGLSASFGSPGGTGSASSADAELRTTRPGSMFLALRDTLVSPNVPRFIGGYVSRYRR